MAIYESGENYLEAILVLTRQKGYVRSIDVATHLGVTKPSVSRAMSILKGNGYIEFADDGRLSLTEEGLEIASRMYERHETLTDLLFALGVSRETAVEDACRIEHVISQESFERLKLLLDELNKR